MPPYKPHSSSFAQRRCERTPSYPTSHRRCQICTKRRLISNASTMVSPRRPRKSNDKKVDYAAMCDSGDEEAEDEPMEEEEEEESSASDSELEDDEDDDEELPGEDEDEPMDDVIEEASNDSSRRKKTPKKKPAPKPKKTTASKKPAPRSPTPQDDVVDEEPPAPIGNVPVVAPGEDIFRAAARKVFKQHAPWVLEKADAWRATPMYRAELAEQAAYEAEEREKAEKKAAKKRGASEKKSPAKKSKKKTVEVADY